MNSNCLYILKASRVARVRKTMPLLIPGVSKKLCFYEFLFIDEE